MVTYKGEEVQLSEAERFKFYEFGKKDYTVTTEGGLVFQASSRFGRSFAMTPDDALQGAYRMIDQAKGGR